MTGPTKLYQGRRTPDGCEVTVDGRPLNPRLDLHQYAAGFEWGYDGTGPRQLALALLAEHHGKDEPALAGSATLVRALLETLEGETWSLTGEDIERALAGYLQVPTDLAGLLARIRGEG
ncbi:MAG: hypothetical protein EXQ94_12375 [Alphaproteobacteria bacterium]|nr:hypothetical protein [Alphaproteobacteria bacterium]